MLDYQAIIKSDTATRLLNVFTFEYNYFVHLLYVTKNIHKERIFYGN